MESQPQVGDAKQLESQPHVGDAKQLESQPQVGDAKQLESQPHVGDAKQLDSHISEGPSRQIIDSKPVENPKPIKYKGEEEIVGINLNRDKAAGITTDVQEFKIGSGFTETTDVWVTIRKTNSDGKKIIQVLHHKKSPQWVKENTGKTPKEWNDFKKENKKLSEQQQDSTANGNIEELNEQALENFSTNTPSNSTSNTSLRQLALNNYNPKYSQASFLTDSSKYSKTSPVSSKPSPIVTEKIQTKPVSNNASNPQQVSNNVEIQGPNKGENTSLPDAKEVQATSATKPKPNITIGTINPERGNMNFQLQFGHKQIEDVGNALSSIIVVGKLFKEGKKSSGVFHLIENVEKGIVFFYTCKSIHDNSVFLWNSKDMRLSLGQQLGLFLEDDSIDGKKVKDIFKK